jgi:cell division septation protein DedD
MIASLTGFQTQTEQAQAAAEGIITTLQTELDEIHDVTDEWNDHEAAMQATIEAYEDLIDDLGDLLDELADLQAALDDINDSDTTHVDVTTTTTTTPSPSADTPTSSSPTTSSSTPQSTEHTHNKDGQMYVGSERHYKCTICGKDMGPVEGTIGSQ